MINKIAFTHPLNEERHTTLHLKWVHSKVAKHLHLESSLWSDTLIYG